MSIAEAAVERLSFKAHSTGVITSGSEPVLASDPGASGAQILRHVSHTFNLTRNASSPNEKRDDDQMAMGRLGIKRVPAQINGILSPGTYADLFEASLRSTWAAAVTASEADFTSCAADNATAKFTFASGDPVTKGYRVGDIIRFTNLSAAGNNAKNFLILGFGGTSNREVTVYPAPTTHTADTAFTMTSAGQSLYIPDAASRVNRLFAFEVYNPDIDNARVYSECRVGGFQVSAPPNDNVSLNFNVLGRNRTIYTAGAAPFFTSPTAATTTDFCNTINGLLRVNGANVGIVTTFNLTVARDPQGPDVQGTTIVPEIFLPNANVSGDFSVFMEDSEYLDLLADETEFQFLAYLTASDDAAADAMTILLPRCKATATTESDDGSGGKLIQVQFMTGRYVGAAPGVVSTSIRITDTTLS